MKKLLFFLAAAFLWLVINGAGRELGRYLFTPAHAQGLGQNILPGTSSNVGNEYGGSYAGSNGQGSYAGGQFSGQVNDPVNGTTRYYSGSCSQFGCATTYSPEFRY